MTNNIQTENLLLLKNNGKATAVEVLNADEQKTFVVFPNGNIYELKSWENNTIELKDYPQKLEVME
ncbi:MAG: hypothetical protein LBM93_10210 [Oscillospiraceae bacterium]|jgi:hypothetical protein|nr:hypothetical protein [Oscillospiraceae bacterium]